MNEYENFASVGEKVRYSDFQYNEKGMSICPIARRRYNGLYPEKVAWRNTVKSERELVERVNYEISRDELEHINCRPYWIEKCDGHGYQ